MIFHAVDRSNGLIKCMFTEILNRRVRMENAIYLNDFRSIDSDGLEHFEDDMEFLIRGKHFILCSLRSLSPLSNNHFY